MSESTGGAEWKRAGGSGRAHVTKLNKQTIAARLTEVVVVVEERRQDVERWLS
jgi:hypothetical protein